MRNLPFLERNVRRSRVYGGRLLRSFAMAPLRSNCCFYHIPKSGGTSLSEALHAAVPISRHIGEVSANTTRRAASIIGCGEDDEVAYYDDGEKATDVFALREALQLAFMANDVALVHGHMIFSARADRHFGERYKYVTMLRAPEDRVISNYRAARRAGYVDLPFADYLDTVIGRNHATHNLRYLSGRAHIPSSGEDAALEAAKANMARFAVIGFVDEMDAFLDRFEAQFGVRLAVGTFNRAKAPMPDLSDRDHDKLKRACEADAELHAYATRLMAREPGPAANPASERTGGEPKPPTD